MSDPTAAPPVPGRGSNPAAPSGRASAAGDAERLAAALARMPDAPQEAEELPAAATDMADLVALAAALTALPDLPAERRAAIDRALALPDTGPATGDIDSSNVADLVDSADAGAPSNPADAPPSPSAPGRWPAAIVGVLLLLAAARLIFDPSASPRPPDSSPDTPIAHIEADDKSPDATPVFRRRTDTSAALAAPTGAIPSGAGSAGSTGSRPAEPARSASATRRVLPVDIAAQPTLPPSLEALSPPTLSATALPATSPPRAAPRSGRGGPTLTTTPPPSVTPPLDEGSCAGPAAPGTLTLRVVDGAGTALPDAELAIGRAPDGPLDVFAVTGSDGCRRVRLAPGAYHVRATWSGTTRWYPSAADRAAAGAVALDATALSLTVVVDGGQPPLVPPGNAALELGPGEAHAPTAHGSRNAPAAPRPHAANARNGAYADAYEAHAALAGTLPGALPDDIAQTGGAVTNVAYDPSSGTVWAIVGPRVTAWRVAASGWTALGRSDVLPAVPEALAVGGGHVAIGLPGRGGPGEIWLFDAAASVHPTVRARVPLAHSGAAAIGALAIGGALVWAVTERGVSIVDLKPASPAEVSSIPTAFGREAAMDALAWQGDVAVLEEPRYGVVVRPWGLWVIDALDPRRPRVRSSPELRSGAPSGPPARWPAFAVDARGLHAALVDVDGRGPGRLTVLDLADPDRPSVHAVLEIDDVPPAAAAARPAHIRDDPAGGRSRGAAAAWRGDGITVLSADARWWAHASLQDREPAWSAAGASAAWDASRSALAVTRADHATGTDPSAPSFVAAGGDAGLVAHFGAAPALPALGIAPPLWQTILGGDGRHVIGAAGRAGLASFRVDSDHSGRGGIDGGGITFTAATRLEGGPGEAGQAADCGAVLAVAVDRGDSIDAGGASGAGGGAAALTEHCGLVTLSFDSDGRPRVDGRLGWLTPQTVQGAQAVPLAVRDGWAAWVETTGGGSDGAFVAVADVRSPERPRRTGRIQSRHGVPIAIGAARDAWLIVASSGVESNLEVWPAAEDADAPRSVASLSRAYRVIAADGDTVRLSHPATGAAAALVALGPAGAAVRSERPGWGLGAVARADTAFGRGDLLLASDGAGLGALDVRYDLAPLGQPIALPHGQPIDRWGTSPQRDDVLWSDGDAIMALGDAGMFQVPGEALGAEPSAAPAPAGRPSPIYLPRLGADLGGPQRLATAPPEHRVVLLFDGSAMGAAWWAANGGPDTLAAAVRSASTVAGPNGHLTLARWDDWALRLARWTGDDAAARTLAGAIAAAPGRERRADAALALAADVLGAAPSIEAPAVRRAVLVAAGDVAGGSINGAAARARVLRAGGVALTVVLLGVARPAPGLAHVAEAGGTVVRSAVDGAGLAEVLGSVGREAGDGLGQGERTARDGSR